MLECWRIFTLNVGLLMLVVLQLVVDCVLLPQCSHFLLPLLPPLLLLQRNRLRLTQQDVGIRTVFILDMAVTAVDYRSAYGIAVGGYLVLCCCLCLCNWAGMVLLAWSREMFVLLRR